MKTLSISLCLLVWMSFSIAYAESPDIVLFVADDHGVLDSGVYGSPDARTPNIDALASQGMRFTHAFAESPLCSPSRCVIQTGLSPFRNGGHKFGDPIRLDIRTMPEYFAELGYFTAHFGKFHHGPRNRFPYDQINGDENLAAAFLNEYDQDQPLLLVVCTHPPHTPWVDNDGYDPDAIDLPETFIDTPETRIDRTEYLSDVSLMDSILGSVLQTLEATGRDDALFIYTSDQGANWPFAKWCCYDAGLQVPLIARWPDRVEEGAVSDAMVMLSDLLPTMIEAAGGAEAEGLDGRSFLDVALDRKEEHRSVVFGSHTGNDNGGPGIANHCPTRTIRTERYRLIQNLDHEQTFFTHIVGCKDGPHYLPFWDSWVAMAETDPGAANIVNRYLHRPPEELYDLDADPLEQNNLIGSPELAEVEASLRLQLHEWRREQGDPIDP